MKTREQVEKMKQLWLETKDFDLANLEGFEDYKEELEAFVDQHTSKSNDDMMSTLIREGVKLLPLLFGNNNENQQRRQESIFNGFLEKLIKESSPDISGQDAYKMGVKAHELHRQFIEGYNYNEALEKFEEKMKE